MRKTVAEEAVGRSSLACRGARTRGDGDLDWQALVPHLTDRFTCHLPSMRGRGLSGDHPDLSLGRVVDDMLAYVDSIGNPDRTGGLVRWRHVGPRHGCAV